LSDRPLKRKVEQARYLGLEGGVECEKIGRGKSTTIIRNEGVPFQKNNCGSRMVTGGCRTEMGLVNTKKGPEISVRPKRGGCAV